MPVSASLPLPASPDGDEKKPPTAWAIGKVAFPILVSVLSLGVAALSWLEAAKSTRAAEESARSSAEANQRNSGRIRAQIELLGGLPDDKSTRDRTPAPPEGGDAAPAYMLVAGPGALFGVNPRAVLKNSGEEPIEAVRVCVEFAGYDLPAKLSAGTGSPVSVPTLSGPAARSPTLLRTFLNKPVPVGALSVDQVHREDFVLDRKLMKGDVACVPFSRGVLSQLLTAQQDGGESYRGVFKIRCFAPRRGGDGLRRRGQRPGSDAPTGLEAGTLRRGRVPHGDRLVPAEGGVRQARRVNGHSTPGSGLPHYEVVVVKDAQLR